MSKVVNVPAPHPVDAPLDPYENYDLPIKGFKGSPEEIERQWYENCFLTRGDTVKQLSGRALIMGSLLGGILSLTNLYIGLKAGWAFGVAITACILSYAIWTFLYKVRIAKTPMTILENNCMQSTASSAGYSTGGTLVSAFSAYILVNNHSMPMGLMLGWVFFLAVLGVTMAIPMKRTMINTDQLPFPSGIAAAETLRALHAKGEKGIRAARALMIAGVAAAVSQFWVDGLRLINAGWEKFQIPTFVNWVNQHTFGTAWMQRTVRFEWDPIFIAAGGLVGMRVGLSMLLGATTCWAIYIPILQHRIPEVAAMTAYRDLVQWALWGGVACMVTSSLLGVILQWRSAARAFQSLGSMFSRRTGPTDPMEAIETPVSWFFAGQLFSLIGLAWLAHASFGMPYWQSTIAVILAFGLALVACRVTGETDTTPVGPMGKVAQLLYGVLSPGNMNINLMSANITAGSATSSADLLTDLKSGYLLGAHPRKQFLAQFTGIFIGTVVTVFTFNLLVPNASFLGTDQFPAPAAQTWRAVAIALSKGFSALHPVKVWAMLLGGIFGIMLVVLPKLFPKKAHVFPSPAGFGLAWTFHWYYSLLFTTGAFAAWIWRKQNAKKCEEYLFPVCSGVIAGGALMGVALIFWENGPEMLHKLLGH
jgi:putative OPT family oligopeptide transporter